MSGIRPAAVAGTFYPDKPAQLRADIRDMLSSTPAGNSAPKAIIVPHAGYIYSGSIAARAYAQLVNARNLIKCVILLGPCHHVPLTGLATTSNDYFETPLGLVPINHDAISSILSLPQVMEFDLTHQQEHSLEVQLPFLQEVLDEFALVPLVVGDSSAEDISEVLEILWGSDETLIVISTDLSHYHDYRTAQTMDNLTCKAIETLDGTAISQQQACGRSPVLGLLQAAQHHGLKVTTLELKNSGDTAGSKDQVVGYGAWMFEETSA